MAKINLAYNLGNPVDNSPELPFNDLMKVGRAWLNGWNDGWDEIAPYVDANGWPTQMPPGWTVIRNSWALPYGNVPHVLTYEGEGTLALFNVTITDSSTPGRIEFTNAGANENTWLDITETDPNDNGEHIRNIKIFRADRETLVNEGVTFNPDFIDNIRDVKLIRTLDWTTTNSSTIVDFADLPTKDWFTYQTGYGSPTFGVPLEVQIELANLIEADLWYCMPHQATDACMQSIAEQVEASLDLGRVFNIEYTNEGWNHYLGTQAGWMAAQATALWGTDAVAGIPPGGLDYQAMRTAQMAKIFKDVFAGQTERIDTIFGSQNVTGALWWLQNRILNTLVWTTKNTPTPVLAFGDYVDTVAVSSYFGGSTMASGDYPTENAEFLAFLGSHTEEETFDYLRDCYLDPDYPESIPKVTQLWEDFKVALPVGMKLKHYEGGSHCQHLLADAQFSTVGVFFYNFHRSPQMAELYEAWYEASAASPIESPPMHFVSVYPNGNRYSWGLRESLTDYTPRRGYIESLARGLTAEPNKGGGTARMAS